MDGRIARGNSATCDGQESEVTLGRGCPSQRHRPANQRNRSRCKSSDTTVLAVRQSLEALDNAGRICDNELMCGQSKRRS